MSRATYLFISSSLIAVALSLSAAASAGPAEDFVRSKHSTLITELKKPASAQKTKKVDAMLSGLFDFEKLTKNALAKHYDSLSPEQVKELQNLVQELVSQNYKKHIQKTIDYDVKFVGEGKSSDGTGSIVRTQVQKRAGKEAPVQVNYQLYQKGKAWIVYDVETEGSSMVRNYRNQFGKIIRRDGADALIRKLRERLQDKSDDK